MPARSDGRVKKNLENKRQTKQNKKQSETGAVHIKA